jgi:hypothetical protein
LAGIVTSGGLKAVDAGSLARARQLVAFGFLQLTLAVNEKVSWTGGFGVIARPQRPTAIPTDPERTGNIMPVNAVRLNHAVLFVADLEGSLAFYQRVSV